MLAHPGLSVSVSLGLLLLAAQMERKKNVFGTQCIKESAEYSYVVGKSKCHVPVLSRNLCAVLFFRKGMIRLECAYPLPIHCIYVCVP